MPLPERRVWLISFVILFVFFEAVVAVNNNTTTTKKFNLVQISSISNNGGFIIPVLRIVDVLGALAIKHFNDRRVDLYPALQSVLNCSIEIDRVAVCDDQFSTLKAASYLLNVTSVLNQMGSPIHAIHGLVVSDIASAVTTISSALGGTYPVISHYATNPLLSSKSLYPNFARTVPSDSATSRLVGDLIRSLNYTHVGMIYVGTEFGVGFKNALFQYLNEYNIRLTFFSYEPGGQKSLFNAFRAIEDTGLNVIVAILSSQEELPFFSTTVLADKVLCLPDKFWIMPTIGGELIPAYRNHPNVTRFLNGAISFFVSVQNPIMENLYNNWKNGTLSVEDVNQAMPPFDKLNNTNFSFLSNGCFKNGLSLKVPNGYFTKTTADLFRNSVNAMYAYDAVMALGLAACKKDGGASSIPTGREFFNLLTTSLSFDGLSGPVRFDRFGDRSVVDFSQYELIQFIEKVTIGINGSNGSSSAVRSIGEYRSLGVFTNGSWNIARLSQGTFKDGTNKLPLEVTPPPQNFNYLNQNLINWGYAQTGILLVLNLGCVLFMYQMRNDPIIIYAQKDVMVLFNFGILLASWVPLLLTADDNPTNPLQNASAACQLSIVLAVFGFSVCGLALLIKMHRLFDLFFSKTLRRATSWTFIVVLMVCFVGEIVIIFAWSFIDPLTFDRVVTQYYLLVYPISSYGACNTGVAGTWFLGVFLFTYAIILVLLLGAAIYVKDLPSKFQESQYILASLLVTFQIYLIAIPAIASTYTQPSGRFIIESSVVFFNCLILLGFMFAPKYVLIVQNKALRTNPSLSTPPQRTPKPIDNVAAPQDVSNTNAAIKFSGISFEGGGYDVGVDVVNDGLISIFDNYYVEVRYSEFRAAAAAGATERPTVSSSLQIARVGLGENSTITSLRDANEVKVQSEGEAILVSPAKAWGGFTRQEKTILVAQMFDTFQHAIVETALAKKQAKGNVDGKSTRENKIALI